MADAIREWLEGLDLGRYAEAFIENEIDLQALPHLTEDDLKDVGVALGARRKLIAAIAEMAGAAATAATPEEDRSAESEAQRRQLTVMFVDLVGSTELSEQHDPEDLRGILRAYQESCTTVVARFDGHVAKYIGDGILVYFGFPQAHEDDAHRAVSAGLGIVNDIGALNQRLAGETGAKLEVRVGIHTGLVVAGEMGGGDSRENNAIVGVTPNLAARLEGLAKPDTVVISQATQALVDGLFDCRDLGMHDLKGVSDATGVFQVLAETDAPSRFEAAVKRGLTPIVGREEEVGLLLKRWEQSKDGEGQVVLLSGEAGVGKSRILRAFRDRIEDEPHSRVLCFGSPYHRNSAFYPAINQLERALRFDREDTAKDRLGKLTATLADLEMARPETAPVLADLLTLDHGGAYETPDVSPQRLKEMTIEALVAMVEAMARRQPVLIVLEDLHVADPSTVELFEQYIERLRGTRVLVLVTFRPEFDPPWHSYANATALVLNRLSSREGARLIETITAGKPLPQDVIDRIVERTDGVPLFVEELTKMVLESDLLTEEDDGYVLTGSLSDLAIPSSLQDSLMARLDRLAPVKEVAQLAAAIGRVFDYDLLAAVSHLDPAALTEALETLVASGLLYRSGGPQQARYEFKHALVQDSAYQSLLMSTRQQHHNRIAQAMLAQFPEYAETQPELLARHFTEASLPDQALPFWLAAARQAAERFAIQEAIVHCERGFELLGDLPQSRERDQQELELLLVFGPAAMTVKGFGSPDIAQTYSRAKELAAGLGDDLVLFMVTWGQWINHQQQAKIDEARGLASDVSAIAKRLGDPELELQALHANWTTDLVTANHQSVSASLEKGLAIYDVDKHRSHSYRFGGHDPGVCANTHGALTSWAQGYPDQALEYSRRSVDLAERISHPLSLAIANGMGSFIRQHRGEVAEVLIFARRTLEVCTNFGVPHYIGISHILHGWGVASSGDLGGGIAEMVQGLDMLDQTGAALRRTYYLTILADMLGRAGRHDDALAALNDAQAAVDQLGETWWYADTQRTLGEIRLSQSRDNVDEAEGCFLGALETSRSQSARSHELRAATSLARLWMTQNRRDEARNLLKPVFDQFTEGHDTADLKTAKEILEELA